MRMILSGLMIVFGVTVVKSLPTDPPTNLFLDEDNDMNLASNTFFTSSLNDPLVSVDLVTSTDELLNQVPNESPLSGTIFDADGSDGSHGLSDTLDASSCTQQLVNRKVSDNLILSMPI